MEDPSMSKAERYTVIGPLEVAEVAPGGVVELDPAVYNVPALMAAGHLEALTDSAAAAAANPAAVVQVPDGTIDDVVVWVGADRGRAAAALHAEQAKASPRTSLVEKLEKAATEPADPPQ